MSAFVLDPTPTRRPRRTPGGCAWLASLLLHVVAGAVAWAVTAPVRHEPTALIGQSLHVEWVATMAPLEFTLPAPAPEHVALPIRIMPAEAEIARRHFRLESTSVSEPTPLELARVEQLMAGPSEVRPSRQPSEPTLAAAPSLVVARQATVSPLPRPPGTVDRPMPELLQSPPPTYPRSAIERQWEGTVLLRLGVTAEGRVGSVAIVRSSGHGVLDGEAARAVRGWRFLPAIEDGRPVASFVRLPVRFDLSTILSAGGSTPR